MDVKNWEDIVAEGLTGRDELLVKLDMLSSLDINYVTVKKLMGAENIVVHPNLGLIKEFNTSFIELMMVDHQYKSKRIVPVMIIRSLIEISAVFYAYLIFPDKRSFLNEYHKGTRINKMELDGKYLSVNRLVEGLDKKYNGYKALYEFCCGYVHSGYDPNKSSTVWYYTTECGRNGFLGKHYKLKFKDFENARLDGYIEDPIYDYEEECDIVEACLWVNGVIKDLVNTIRSEG